MPTKPRTVTHDGQTLTLKGWAARLGVHVETLRCRLDHLGWPVERALAAPADARFRPGGRPSPAEHRPCPKARRHAKTGQAFAAWQDRGRRHYRYFGEWGTAEAKAGYRRFQLEWAAGMTAPDRKPGELVSVARLVKRYLSERVDHYYVKAGKYTSERERQHTASKVLLSLYATRPAAEFTPRDLRACVQAMIEKGWVRKTVNQHQWRIVRCFEWGVGQSLVPPDVHLRLKAVEYQQAGRSKAPDRPRIKPVPGADLERVIPHLHAVPARRAVLADMISVHALTGMRPGELCAITPADVDRSGDVWLYTVAPGVNKNEHRDKPQRYWIGPKAQAILGPYLDRSAPGQRVWRFPPKGRGTVETAVRRPAYAEFVRVACDRAGVPRWHPHQLRHTRATDVAREYESNAAAAAVIGDTPEVAAAVYVDPADLVRRRIAKEMG